MASRARTVPAHNGTYRAGERRSPLVSWSVDDFTIGGVEAQLLTAIGGRDRSLRLWGTSNTPGPSSMGLSIRPGHQYVFYLLEVDGAPVVITLHYVDSEHAESLGLKSRRSSTPCRGRAKADHHRDQHRSSAQTPTMPWIGHRATRSGERQVSTTRTGTHVVRPSGEFSGELGAISGPGPLLLCDLKLAGTR